MTAGQFKKLAERKKFSPEFGTLVDAGTISLVNASIALQLPTEEQNHFLFEAEHFSAKSFLRVVNRWVGAKPERQETIGQILSDLNDAFEAWDTWSGSYDAVEGEEYRQMVQAARERVLCYIHGLPIPKQEHDDHDAEAG